MEESVRKIQYELLDSVKPLLARIGQRIGAEVWLADNPTDGVLVVQEGHGAPSPVALDHGETTELLIAVGKAYAKLVRM